MICCCSGGRVRVVVQIEQVLERATTLRAVISLWLHLVRAEITMLLGEHFCCRLLDMQNAAAALLIIVLVMLCRKLL